MLILDCQLTDLQFLDDQEFAMIIYNAKIIFIIYSEHVGPKHVPWSYLDVMMYNLLLQLWFLEQKTCNTVFI